MFVEWDFSIMQELPERIRGVKSGVLPCTALSDLGIPSLKAIILSNICYLIKIVMICHRGICAKNILKTVLYIFCWVLRYRSYSYKFFGKFTGEGRNLLIFKFQAIILKSNILWMNFVKYKKIFLKENRMWLCI